MAAHSLCASCFLLMLDCMACVKYKLSDFVLDVSYVVLSSSFGVRQAFGWSVSAEPCPHIAELLYTRLDAVIRQGCSESNLCLA